MNIRQAILKAADHIERNPHLFDFGDIALPECGSPGCAIGWIGVHSGQEFKRSGAGTRQHHKPQITLVHSDVCEAVLGVTHHVFYARMDQVSPARWRSNAAECATGLRAYADRYHPAESRALIPESVRAIFTMTPEQLRAEFERA